MDIQRQAKILEKHCNLKHQAALDVAAKLNGCKDWKTLLKSKLWKEISEEADKEYLDLFPEPTPEPKPLLNTYRVSVKGNFEVRVDYEVQAGCDIEAEAIVSDYIESTENLPYGEKRYGPMCAGIGQQDINLIYANSPVFVTGVSSKKDNKQQVHKCMSSEEIEARYQHTTSQSERDIEVEHAQRHVSFMNSLGYAYQVQTWAEHKQTRCSCPSGGTRDTYCKQCGEFGCQNCIEDVGIGPGYALCSSCAES